MATNVNTQLFALPGENYDAYEARVAKIQNPGGVNAGTTTPQPPQTPNTPTYKPGVFTTNAPPSEPMMRDSFGSLVPNPNYKPYTPSTSSGYAPTTPQDILASNKSDAQRLQDDFQARSTAFQNTLTGYQNGTIPLTTGEQAQIDNLKQAYQELIEQQKITNQGAQGLGNIRGYQAGAAEYDPTFQNKTIGSIMNAGLQKIASYNNQLAAAVADLTDSFRTKDMEAARNAYAAYNDAYKERKDFLQNNIKEAQAAVAEAQAKQQAQEQRDLEVSRDATISDIMAKGITSPTQILNYLNGAGGKFTADEVSKTIKSLTEAEKVVPGIVGEWMAAKENDPTLKNITLEDYMNLKDPGRVLDLQQQRLQIAKLQQDLNTSGINADPGEMLGYIQQYAATGQIPTGIPKGTFGIISAGAKELPKQPGTIVDRNTGVKSSSLGSALETAYGATYSALELAKQLKDLDAKRAHGITGGILGAFGQADEQRYADLRSQVVDLLARARSGAALTPSEEKRYSDMIPDVLTTPLGIGANPQKRIDNFISNLRTDLDAKARTAGVAIYGLSTVNVGGNQYTVGDIIKNDSGQSGRVNADGSITLIQ